jgi:hypothetical protein
MKLSTRFRSIASMVIALSVSPLLGGCITANMWKFDDEKSKGTKAALTPLTVIGDCTIVGCGIGFFYYSKNDLVGGL